MGRLSLYLLGMITTSLGKPKVERELFTPDLPTPPNPVTPVQI
jgi:hypothetical protein